jgi:hypothetical protein
MAEAPTRTDRPLIYWDPSRVLRQHFDVAIPNFLVQKE